MPRRHKKIDVENRVVPADVKDALELINDYRLSGRASEARAAIEDEISYRTFLNWLESPARFGEPKRHKTILRIAAQLPRLRVDKQDAYHFALAELDLDLDSQKQVKRFSGLWTIRHKFSGPHTSTINAITIQASDTRDAVIFWTRYTALTRFNVCDGFVVGRRGRLFLLGLSKTTLMSLTFNNVLDDRRDILYGSGLVDDLYEDRFWFSNIAMYRSRRDSENDEYPISPEEERQIQNYLDIFPQKGAA